MFDHLTKEHACKRCPGTNSPLFDLELQVTRCRSHIETGLDRARERFRLFKRVPTQTKHVFLTAEELERMRRSGGAGLYSGASQATIDSNTHFATYRADVKDRPGDKLSTMAIDAMFGYLCAEIQAGREADSRCLCFVSPGIGMKSLTPCPRPEAEVEQPTEELPEPVVTDHMTTSDLGGVDLCFDVNEPYDTPPLAVRYLPQIEERLFWLNSLRNMQDAIAGRINIEPHVPFSLDSEEQRDLAKVVQSFRDELENDKPMIDKIIQEVLGLNWRSKKWTPKRAEKQLKLLRDTYAPQYQFDAAIKLEPSKRGKPPRLLIADGDRGQVMAWVLIGVLEKWMFTRYKHRSIKGMPKVEAMERLVQHLRQKCPTDQPRTGPDVPVAVVENDGTAWDGCMSDALREIVENPVMEDVAKIVDKYFLPEAPPDFIDARLASNALKTLNLAVKKDKGSTSKDKTCDIPKGKCWREVIRSIRRSGCRGTSCLNWLANMVCWCWCLGGANGAKLIKPQGARILCVDGIYRFVKMVFEGDDSILSLHCRNTANNMTEQFEEMLRDRWVKLGHRPKIHWRRPEQKAEFTGWHFGVTPVGLNPDVAAPDLMRNLINMPYSTNPLAIKAAVDGKKDELMQAVAPGVIARLYPLAGKFPVLCEKIYNQFAPYIRGDTEYTLDQQYQLDLVPEDFGFKEFDPNRDVDAEIERSTARCLPILERFGLELAKAKARDCFAEPQLAVALGVTRTTEGYADLLDAIEAGFFVGGCNLTFAEAVQEARES